MTYGRLLRSKKALFDHSPSLLFSPSPAWIGERKSPNMSLFWAFCKCWQKLVKKSFCGPKYYPYFFNFLFLVNPIPSSPLPLQFQVGKSGLARRLACCREEGRGSRFKEPPSDFFDNHFTVH